MKKRFGSTHRTPFASAFHSYPGDGESFLRSFRSLSFREIVEGPQEQLFRRLIFFLGHVDAPHTSCTHRRCYTIDFLWYSSNSLRVTHLGEIPTEEVLRSEEGPAGQSKFGSHTSIILVPNLFRLEAARQRGTPRNSKF